MLPESHAIRIECATRLLAPSPAAAHRFGQLVKDARDTTARRVHPALMEWLPNGLSHFIGIR